MRLIQNAWGRSLAAAAMMAFAGFQAGDIAAQERERPAAEREGERERERGEQKREREGGERERGEREREGGERERGEREREGGERAGGEREREGGGRRPEGERERALYEMQRRMAELVAKGKAHRDVIAELGAQLERTEGEDQRRRVEGQLREHQAALEAGAREYYAIQQQIQEMNAGRRESRRSDERGERGERGFSAHPPSREGDDERIAHLRRAIESLRAAGFGEEAEQLHRVLESRARGGERRDAPDARRPEAVRVPPRPDGEITHVVRELAEQVRQLRRELDEVRRNMARLHGDGAPDRDVPRDAPRDASPEVRELRRDAPRDGDAPRDRDVPRDAPRR